MAREIVDAFKEVVTRLKAANIQGGILEQVKLVEGPTEESFAKEDLPVVIYEILHGGEAEDVGFPDCARAKLTVMLTVMVSVDEGYQSDERSGMLDYYEKIMTVIDGSDLSGSGNWGPVTPRYRVGGFERDGLMNTYLIEVEIQTNRYRRGAL